MKIVFLNCSKICVSQPGGLQTPIITIFGTWVIHLGMINLVNVAEKPCNSVVLQVAKPKNLMSKLSGFLNLNSPNLYAAHDQNFSYTETSTVLFGPLNVKTLRQTYTYTSSLQHRILYCVLSTCLY